MPTFSSPAVCVEHLSKQYRIGEEVVRTDSFRDLLTSRARSMWRKASVRSEPKTFWALKDVSMEVAQGEVVGIIGRNGAGKSTLLKILSRITAPTSGRATIRGRLGSLLEVGTGFHPELTGRENIYLNGAILGMTHTEIDRKLDEIIDFSGVSTFIDTPVKRYSSGMRVRLAFAVAAHLEPEILIVDEVLAVGDAEFQRKCLGKMSDVAQGGRTVLFVSHNMNAVLNLCSRGIVMERGEVLFTGDTVDAIRTYTDAICTPSYGFVDLTSFSGRPDAMRPVIRGLGLRVVLVLRLLGPREHGRRSGVRHPLRLRRRHHRRGAGRDLVGLRPAAADARDPPEHPGAADAGGPRRHRVPAAAGAAHGRRIRRDGHDDQATAVA